MLENGIRCGYVDQVLSEFIGFDNFNTLFQGLIKDLDVQQEARGPSFNFWTPILHECGWYTDYRLGEILGKIETAKEYWNLHSLPQTHIIGQDTTLAQEKVFVEPQNTLDLVLKPIKIVSYTYEDYSLS